MTRVPMRGTTISRSRDSSSTEPSGSGLEPRERVKDCCRKLVAFMCTQVGVGGLVVGYAIVGALGFMMIEGQREFPRELQAESQGEFEGELGGEYREEARFEGQTAGAGSTMGKRMICVREFIRREYADELWFGTASNRTVNIFDKSAFYQISNQILRRYQENFTRGYETEKCNAGLTANELWSFPAALMFCLSVFTMIGYGTLVPQTQWGKGATVVYAVLGIPLYVLYFLNMGKVLAQTFRWLYRRLHECTGQRKPGQRITVPSTACLWVIFAYILAGSIMFAEWEGWDYLDSAYFCVTSLCKIGMGDLVPGWTHGDSTESSQTKLIINFVYLLLGMGLIAMCYNLMKEDVYVKARELKEQLNRVIDVAHQRVLTCCKSDA